MANSLTFTVPRDCRVQATASFDAQVTGAGSADFGGSDRYGLIITEYDATGTTALANHIGPRKGVSTARIRYTDQYTVPVTGGRVITVTLYCATTHVVTVWNLDLRVEVIKA